MIRDLDEYNVLLNSTLWKLCSTQWQCQHRVLLHVPQFLTLGEVLVRLKRSSGLISDVERESMMKCYVSLNQSISLRYTKLLDPMGVGWTNLIITQSTSNESLHSLLQVGLDIAGGSVYLFRSEVKRSLPTTNRKQNLDFPMNEMGLKPYYSQAA